MAFAQGDRSATIRLTIALAFALGVSGYLYYLNLFNREDDLCIPRLEYGQTILFIDKTDAWNDNQAERLEMHVMNILKREMRQEERLHVFSFGASFVQGFPPHFSACKPPDGSECNGIFCNKRLLGKTYDEKFLAPLKEELETLKIARVGDQSPIAEVLYEIMSRSEIKRQPGPTRIVLISDMAQNTDVYSVLQAIARPPAVKRPAPGDDGLRSYFERVKPALRLNDVSAVVFQLIPPETKRRNAKAIGELAQSKWKEVFQMLGIRDQWGLL